LTQARSEQSDRACFVCGIRIYTVVAGLSIFSSLVQQPATGVFAPPSPENALQMFVHSSCIRRIVRSFFTSFYIVRVFLNVICSLEFNRIMACGPEKAVNQSR